MTFRMSQTLVHIILPANVREWHILIVRFLKKNLETLQIYTCIVSLALLVRITFFATAFLNWKKKGVWKTLPIKIELLNGLPPLPLPTDESLSLLCVPTRPRKDLGVFHKIVRNWENGNAQYWPSISSFSCFFFSVFLAASGFGRRFATYSHENDFM